MDNIFDKKESRCTKDIVDKEKSIKTKCCCINKKCK